MKRTYLAIYEKADTNWSAYFPQVGGCVVTGKTLESTKRKAREALTFHLEGLFECGIPMPEVTAVDLEAVHQQFPFEYAGYVEIELSVQAAA